MVQMTFQQYRTRFVGRKITKIIANSTFMNITDPNFESNYCVTFKSTNKFC